MKNEYIWRRCAEMLFIAGFCTSTFANQENVVAGNVGKLYVHGSLIESACNIEMASLDQSINLGNIETRYLKHIGDRAASTTFQIKLENCGSAETLMLDNKTGLKTWSTSQPGMKIRFLAKSDTLNPNIIHVNGAKGLGLEISDSNNSYVEIGQLNRPVLLDTPQSILTYRITPVKTGPLEPNVFDALISFELVYE